MENKRQGWVCHLCHCLLFVLAALHASLIIVLPRGKEMHPQRLCQQPGAKGGVQSCLLMSGLSARAVYTGEPSCGTTDLVFLLTFGSTCLGGISFCLDYSSLQENLFTVFFLAVFICSAVIDFSPVALCSSLSCTACLCL